ncbi:MAG: sensor histidine kinase [Planctomycetota bacterium]
MRLRTQPWHGDTGGHGPARFFVVFLATMFALELGIMAVLPRLVPRDAPPLAAAVIDGAVLTAILAPLVWFGFVRPVQRLHESRGLLLDRLLSAQEDERRRIAADLHDGLGQNLTTMLLRLSVIADSATTDAVRENAAALREIASTSLAEIRELVRETRPPVLDDLGLAAALDRQLADVAAATGIAATFSWPDGDSRRFAPEIETAVYRVVQEAVTNAVRHAAASRIEVALAATAETLRAIIRDDGRGFDVRGALQPARQPFGLLGMRERVAVLGGVMDVTSEPGRGTVVEARIPLGQGASR